MLRPVLLFVLFFPFVLPAQDLLLTEARYLDVQGGKWEGPADILIREGKIAEIGKKARKKAQNPQLLSMEDKWVIPGLIDGHIHLFQSGGLYTRPDAIDLRAIRPYDQERSWTEAHYGDFLRRYLRLGITSVIDCGGPMNNLRARDSLNADVSQATLYLAGPLISTYVPEAFKIDDPPIIKVESTTEALRMVEEQAEAGADFIKIWYIDYPPGIAAENYEMVRSVIELSHQKGLPVAVHATELATAKRALRAGADYLVHSVAEPLDNEFIDLINKQGARLCPTLYVGRGYEETFAWVWKPTPQELVYGEPYTLGSLFDLRHMKENKLVMGYRQAGTLRLEMAEKEGTITQKNLSEMVELGLPIVTGTDAGNIGTLHGASYFRELELMLKAGMSPAQILKASTLDAARSIGLEDELGSLEIGKIADLVVLNGDPLADLENLKDPKLVVHRGQVIAPDTLISTSPEVLAQQQLNAYNAGDLDAFLEPYADSVVVGGVWQEGEWYRGKAAMRSRYKQFFIDNPDLHCELVGRMVMGNTVIDQERVTGLSDGRVLEALAIYEIRDGKIVEVRFATE